MKILYIDHYAGSPEYGMEYRPYYLAKEWVDSGHQVTIVGASFSHLRKSQPVKSSEYIEGIRYLWLSTPQYEKNDFRRMANIISFVVRLFGLTKEVLRETFDVVIASSTYPFDTFPAHFLAKRWRAVNIYEVHDLWPLSPIELGGYSRFNPAIILTQAFENYAYRSVDVVVSLLPLAESYMRSKGLSKGKFYYIPNGIVASEWGEKIGHSTEIITKINDLAKNRFVVGYAGAHGLANALDSFIEAASRMPEVVFVMVGNGPEKSRLMVKAASLENVLFFDSASKTDIPSILGRMDALYLGLQRQSLFRFGISPNKLMDYLMAGKPIICAIEAGNDIVSQANCGYSIEPEDPGQIVDAIRKLMKMTIQERNRLGENGKRYVLDNHDYHILAANFIEVMQKAIERK